MSELQHYAWYQLRATLRLLAAPAEEQLRAYPDFVPAGDELVLEFDDFFRMVDGRLRDRVPGEQWAALQAIDRASDDMSARKDEALFTDQAVREHPAWEELRRLAAIALREFGWSLQAQPDERPIDYLTSHPEPDA